MGTYARDNGLSYYRSRIAACDALTNDQEAQLATAWRAGDSRAGSRLIEGNLRHVITIAREYRRWGVAMDDLVQQGNIGLLKAAQRFDPSQQTSLKTYAAYWVRAEIRDYVVRSYRIVRLGTTRTERRALRAFRTSSVQNVEELAARSGMPEARCKLLWPLLAHGDRSLDSAPPGGVPAREALRGEGLDPEHLAMQREARTETNLRIEHALSVLSEREQRIVWARLAEDEPETLEQIGKRIGVSRERVRQLEQRARQKLRDALEAVPA
jgi:RNA polymerase sigma-32 factor